MPDETTPMTSPGPQRDPSSRHGRFVPGVMFGKRYRILGLLGRGGMGEVYRADDLELGQTVALKLLPSGLTGDEAALDHLRNEVRVARHVSHPNVCRVYDIGEVEGQYFVSMEYVDGEDLASLLRRIGRLSKEKGLDIIAQLAAGLAAAHQLGVLHRDLKPANIMVDGHGRVRIMDFGLAGFAEELRGSKDLAGTLSYMAPEQLAGEGASMRSDVYALGLVMYEILTGRRTYQPMEIDRLRKAQAEAPPPLPSSIVSDLDPAVERVVMWCLEADPGRRPTSAQAVAKALPGGDPLAVALAAGETPSPEMVAAAGGHGGMRPVFAGLCLAGIIVGLLVIAGINNTSALFRLVRVDKPPIVLADHARQVLGNLGFEEEPGADAYGLGLDRSLLRHIERTDSGPERWRRLKESPYPIYYLWYRESPSPLIPYDTRDAEITYHDPPMNTPGMAYLRLAMDGRLLAFEAVPSPVVGWRGNPEAVDWSMLFDEARIDPGTLREIEPAGLEIKEAGRKWQGPLLSPRVPVDHVEIWQGLSPWRDQDSIRVRAAAYQGKPVYFTTHIIYGSPADSFSAGGSKPDSVLTAGNAGAKEASGPGFGAGVGIGEDASGPEGADASPTYNAGVIVGVVVAFAILALVVVVLIGGPIMAWRNLRMGRGDRRGALRFGLFALGLILLNALLLADHAVLMEDGALNLGYEINMLLGKLGMSILYGAYVALAYLALEPYVRRHWPDALISWTRLLRGKLGDPLVGRDLLLGAVAGVTVTLIWLLRYASPAWFGWAPPRPFGGGIDAMMGGAGAIAAFVSPGFLLPSMFCVLALVLLVILFRRRWVGLVVFIAMVLAVGALADLGGMDGDGGGLVTLVCLLAMVVILAVLFVRSGLLALTVAFFFFGKIRGFPLTLDSSAWYAGTSSVALLAMIGIAVYGLSTAIRGYSRASRAAAEGAMVDGPSG